MASSSSGVVKRERGDDEVEGTAKQAKCVKEESSMKPMVPKIEGSVAASPSPGVGLLRRLNLAAGICWRFSNSDLVCELGFGTTTEDSTGALDQDGADHAVTHTPTPPSSHTRWVRAGTGDSRPGGELVSLHGAREHPGGPSTLRQSVRHPGEWRGRRAGAHKEREREEHPQLAP